VGSRQGNTDPVVDFYERLRALASTIADSEDPALARCAMVLLALQGVLANSDVGRLDVLARTAGALSGSALAELERPAC
jgi:hypothetical protein